MTRQPDSHPTKAQLREMTETQLAVYIRELRKELEWRRGGPVHKVRTKQLEVALKMRNLRDGDRSYAPDSRGAPNARRLRLGI
jgi:hypothetical protein